MQSRAVLIGALCASARCRLLALDGIAFRLVARPVLPMRYVHRRWAYLVITPNHTPPTCAHVGRWWFCLLALARPPRPLWIGGKGAKGRGFRNGTRRIIYYYILVDRDITRSYLIFSWLVGVLWLIIANVYFIIMRFR